MLVKKFYAVLAGIILHSSNFVSAHCVRVNKGVSYFELGLGLIFFIV